MNRARNDRGSGGHLCTAKSIGEQPVVDSAGRCTVCGAMARRRSASASMLPENPDAGVRRSEQVERSGFSWTRTTTPVAGWLLHPGPRGNRRVSRGAVHGQLRSRRHRSGEGGGPRSCRRGPEEQPSMGSSSPPVPTTYHRPCRLRGRSPARTRGDLGRRAVRSCSPPRVQGKWRRRSDRDKTCTGSEPGFRARVFLPYQPLTAQGGAEQPCSDDLGRTAGTRENSCRRRSSASWSTSRCARRPPASSAPAPSTMVRR